VSSAPSEMELLPEEVGSLFPFFLNPGDVSESFLPGEEEPRSFSILPGEEFSSQEILPISLSCPLNLPRTPSSLS